MRIFSLTLLFFLASCGRGPGEAGLSPDERYSYSYSDTGGERCVSDARTGLQWQLKSTTTGLHNDNNSYSWFDPDEANGELDYRGLEDGGTCDGSLCDTWHYVQAINEAGYCGQHDWRMPSKDELYSISDLRRTQSPPTIDSTYFPLTHADEYWSGNDYSFQHDAAWAWNFELGHDRVDWKKTPKYIRLVRGEARALKAVKE